MHPLAEASDLWGDMDAEELKVSRKSCSICGSVGTYFGSKYCRTCAFVRCDKCGVSFRRTGRTSKSRTTLCVPCKYEGVR